MKNNVLAIEVRKVIDKLISSEISSYVDSKLTPPNPFRSKGKITLIVLGQDPTVHNPKHRENIKVTLLLNQPGRLRRYLEDICNALDIKLDENIYATNLLKNFFSTPPDKLRKMDKQFFNKAAAYWIPLLKSEIEKFKNIPILTLGEPILNCLTISSKWELIRYHWGYEGPAQYGKNFSYLKPIENVLSRVVFPFPHLPGLSHKIYRQQKDGYLAFMKEHINP